MEVLVAVSLVAASALIVAATTPVAQAARGKAALYSKAVGAAQKEIESIRGAGYVNINPTQLYSLGLIDSATTVTVPTLTNVGAGIAPPVMTGSCYTFTNVDSGSNDSIANNLPSGQGYVMVEQPTTNLRRVTVAVTYLERGVMRIFCTALLVGNL